MAVVLRNSIFVHVSKTGGMSVSQALGGAEDTRRIPHHVPSRCLTHLDKPMFGFVRDPWERMASLYFFLWQTPRHHLPRVDSDAIREMGFKRWLLEGENWMSNEPIDGRVFNRRTMRYEEGFTYRGIERLSHPTLGLPPQQRRPVVPFYLDKCEFIGKTENLASDLRTALQRFGEDSSVRLGHINRTKAKRDTWRQLYDSETIEHVRHYFAADIEFGGYEWT